MNTNPPFHLAIEAKDLTESRLFYGSLLGCEEGRSSSRWVDFNFFGHQLVCHLANDSSQFKKTHNPVDGQNVPVPHFGLVLEMAEWQELSARLKEADIEFIIEPHIRFKGEAGEQATLFLLDPSGNALEFKAFANPSEQLFAK